MFDPRGDHSDARSTFRVTAPQAIIEERDDEFEHLVHQLQQYQQGYGCDEIPLARTEGLL